MKPTAVAIALCVVGLDAGKAQTYNLTTLAGAPRFGVDATGNPASFFWPAGIAVDGAGNAYVVEWGKHSIRKVTPTGAATTLAGLAGAVGTADGTGNEARFYASPFGALGVAADHDGNVFVADFGNHTIRKVAVNGVVSTLAGSAGSSGAADGTGSSARFHYPASVTVDRGGNVFVADSLNHTIRKITPAGAVSTLAGLPGSAGSIDGAGPGARFWQPTALTVDDDGTLYVASYDDTIRKVTPSGVVTTLAGRARSSGARDGAGGDARFFFSYNFPFDMQPLGVAVDPAGNVFAVDPGNFTVRRISSDGVVTTPRMSGPLHWPGGVAVDSAGRLYIADLSSKAGSGDASGRIVMAVPDSAPTITSQPHSQAIAPGSTVVFSFTAGGASGLSYQWRKDGKRVEGATRATLVIWTATPDDAGRYTCIVTDSTGFATSSAATLSVVSAAVVGRLVNLSVRAPVGSGPETLTMGATIAGPASNGSMPVLLRGVGPSLVPFGVTGFLTDPQLTLLLGRSVISSNDNWGGDVLVAARTAQVGAFPYSSPASRDATLALDLTPNTYHVQISGNGGASGTALCEIFDATLAGSIDPATPHLVNLSVRQRVDGDADMIIAGFVIGGQTARTVFIRAIGPSLAALGVTGVLADPMLQLFSGTGLMRDNNDWGGDDQLSNAGRSVGAFALASADSKDSVILATLPPGSYTVQVSGSNSGAGIALAEIYEVP